MTFFMSLFAKKASERSQKIEKLLYVYEIKTAEALLKNKAMSFLLAKLKKESFIDQDLFSQTYQALLYSFSACVQMLSLEHGRHGQSHLMYASKRALAHWLAFKELLIAQYGKRYLATDGGARLLYAVFSSSLLFEIAKLNLHIQVVLCDKEGRYQGDWNMMLKTSKLPSFLSLPSLLSLPPVLSLLFPRLPSFSITFI